MSELRRQRRMTSPAPGSAGPFVSSVGSTFEDFIDERNASCSATCSLGWPNCARSRARSTAIDLRWGVQAEEPA